MKQEKLLSLELKIALLLRWGVMAAGALMLIGWMTLLDFSHNPLAAFHEYKGESLKHGLQTALDNGAWGLLVAYLGLGLLISLPLLRVLMTAVLFVKQKERVLAAIAFFVFAALILSFTLGIEL